MIDIDGLARRSGDITVVDTGVLVRSVPRIAAAGGATSGRRRRACTVAPACVPPALNQPLTVEPEIAR